ncbi:UNKNOWN [Stylonychia lemnae]|uniref:Uncharacterized protein n=1 Tax=Stylonychia lemnae TaxID=5949 RepID=A0A078AX19_STYLE|nr:UNKNOWN [Stylonychia lemnae]|eukprot:CDW86606.1 UNKNOWN [Stylonychia lemnae]
MSYVTDSLGWSERVKMENGAQSSQQDYELGRSNPNHVSYYRDIMQRSQQNFKIVSENQGQAQNNVQNSSVSPVKANKNLVRDNSQRYFKNHSPKHASQNNYFKTINQGGEEQNEPQEVQKSRTRPQSSSTKGSYVKRAVQSKNQISRKLRFGQKVQQANNQNLQAQKDQRFNEDLQSVKSFRSRESNFKIKTNFHPGSHSNNNVNNLMSLKQANQQRKGSQQRNESANNQQRYLRNSSQILSRGVQNLTTDNAQALTHRKQYQNASQITHPDEIKQKIIEKVQQLDHEELDKLRETLRLDDEQQQQQENDYMMMGDGQLQLQENMNFYPQQDELTPHQMKHQYQQNQDDNLSVYSKLTKSSMRSIGAQSMRSSRTYASQLEQKLEKEKQARRRLEKEVEELKRISTAISSQMGWSKNQ